jgi:hypothetical protein
MTVAWSIINGLGMTVVSSLALNFEIQTQSPLLLDAHETRRYLRQTGPGPHAPLYRGMGTHFIYIWVGTPPQRVSVIVDTGSHFTAFPCQGCSNCGTHTDSYYNPKSSSTSLTQHCGGGNQLCRFSQSYTEGSSWQAYKVSDIVWIGGERVDMLQKLPKHSVNFTFGCQTSETGLFRTQVENGIMGLSSDPNTLPHVLHSKHLLPTRSFSLCLLATGGLMSIGEEEQEDEEQSEGGERSLTEDKGGLEEESMKNKKKKRGAAIITPSSFSLSSLNLHPMKFAQLVSKSGYYTVFLESILFKMTPTVARGGGDVSEGEAVYHELSEPMTKLNTGKGIIVDSGTTDSYLPSSIANSFRKLFQKLTGILPTNSAIALTPEQHRHLPTIVYRVTAAHATATSAMVSSKTTSRSNTIDIEFPPWNYLELQRDGRYVLRLYLTEGSGGVIGANMMIGHHVLFQPDQQRIGFAKSECRRTGEALYDEVTKPKKITQS